MRREAGVRGALAVRESGVPWTAELLSVAGAQLARAGLAVLVYRETSSAGWTALAYALTFTPAILLDGAPFGRLADRVPRLVGCIELLRAGLAAPGLLNALPRRAAATGAVMVASFLGGGSLAVVDPRLALGLAAVPFAAAVILALSGLAPRPAVHRPAGPFWLVVPAMLVIPAGLAAPYAATLGGTAGTVGLLLAVVPAGGVLGALLAASTHDTARHTTRPAVTVWLAVGAGVSLAAGLLGPPLPVVVALWAGSGACATASLVHARARLLPGRAATSGLAAQGVAVIGAGVLADTTSPVFAVGAGGVAGALLTAVVGMSWLRAPRRHDTVHDTGVTSPSSASLLPPPMGTADPDGDDVFTNPRTASRLPPSEESAAEHGDGNAGVDSGLTNPTTASLVPPSEGVAAEHGNGSADQVRVARSHESASLSTDQRSRRPAGWALWQEPRRLLVMILLVEVVAAGLTGYFAWHSVVTAADLVILGITVGLGLSIGELTRNVERVRRRFNDTPHVNLTSVWSFSAVLTLPPALVPVVISSLYLYLFWRSWYRVRSVHAYRLVFTASTVMLGAYTASALRHWLAPADLADWDHPIAIVAVLLAALAYAGVNWGLIVMVITLHQRTLSVRKAFGTGREAALEFGTIGLGATTALLISLHPAWALMIVPALLVLHRSVLMRQLEEAASTDQKTGVANATAWTSMATAEIQRATRDGTEVGVLMIDLDHFKSVNDVHGHLVGDRVLQAVADTLSNSARRYDVVGRWGGEEFVMLCPEVTEEELRQIGERVCERVRQLRVPMSERPNGQVVEGLSVSIGLALFPEFGPDLQDVLLAADDALFVAKDSGRNQVQTIVAAIGDLNGGPR